LGKGGWARGEGDREGVLIWPLKGLPQKGQGNNMMVLIHPVQDGDHQANFAHITNPLENKNSIKEMTKVLGSSYEVGQLHDQIRSPKFIPKGRRSLKCEWTPVFDVRITNFKKSIKGGPHNALNTEKPTPHPIGW
jgi:hypothetical protein